MKKYFPLVMVLSAFLLAFLPVTPFLGKAEGDAGHVGNKKCQECHPADFAKTLHGRALGSGEKPGDRGCESCHGPGGDHVNNPSKETILTFGKDSKQSPEMRSAPCLSCHKSSPNLALWDMGQHKKHDVACSSCHALHVKKEAKQSETCFTCHKDIRFQTQRQSRHPIQEGKVNCSDCHNPHGTLSHGMIKADNINQLCYKCHADKRGPFVWEHPPVEENCAVCHNSHGSKVAKLLKAKVPNLCQDCHDWSRHPGTIYDQKTAFKGSSPSNRMLARSCNNCHNAVHGGNAPVDPSFGYSSGKAFVR